MVINLLLHSKAMAEVPGALGSLIILFLRPLIKKGSICLSCLAGSGQKHFSVFTASGVRPVEEMKFNSAFECCNILHVYTVCT